MELKTTTTTATTTTTKARSTKICVYMETEMLKRFSQSDLIEQTWPDVATAFTIIVLY